MRVWPTTNWVWFDLVTLTLKVGLVFSVPVLLACHHAVTSPSDLFPDGSRDEMSAVAKPVEIFCLIAGEILFLSPALAAYCQSASRAVWSFIFVILAVFAWLFAASFTMPAM